jgi:virulence-associated protein VapD
MANKGEKGYSKGYSKIYYALAQSLATTGFTIYKGIVYIYILLLVLAIRMASYALHNRYNRTAMHSTLYTGLQ